MVYDTSGVKGKTLTEEVFMDALQMTLLFDYYGELLTDRQRVAHLNLFVECLQAVFRYEGIAGRHDQQQEHHHENHLVDYIFTIWFHVS